jgi:hypothetical protein
VGGPAGERVVRWLIDSQMVRDLGTGKIIHMGGLTPPPVAVLPPDTLAAEELLAQVDTLVRKAREQLSEIDCARRGGR